MRGPREPAWHLAPGGHWLVYGSHDILNDALSNDHPIWVTNKDETRVEVRLEHVTSRYSDGNAYGWPKGTRATSRPATEVAPAARPKGYEGPRSRRHSGTRRSGRMK